MILLFGLSGVAEMGRRLRDPPRAAPSQDRLGDLARFGPRRPVLRLNPGDPQG